jgi:hypothetical protein
MRRFVRKLAEITRSGALFDWIVVPITGFVVIALLLGLQDLRAQVPIQRAVPLGFITCGVASATLLSACSTGVPASATYAMICATTQGINYRDDGVAPTATVGSGGIGIASGTCITYAGNLLAIQFIQQSATAVLGVAFYRTAG